MKLLYAEDEPAMAEAVTDILNYHNFMVDAVADGEEALAYARAGDYDGIILDIMLPKMSGLDVLRELRSWSSLPEPRRSHCCFRANSTCAARKSPACSQAEI